MPWPRTVQSEKYSAEEVEEPGVGGFVPAGMTVDAMVPTICAGLVLAAPVYMLTVLFMVTLPTLVDATICHTLQPPVGHGSGVVKPGATKSGDHFKYTQSVVFCK